MRHISYCFHSLKIMNLITLVDPYFSLLLVNGYKYFCNSYFRLPLEETFACTVFVLVKVVCFPKEGSWFSRSLSALLLSSRGSVVHLSIRTRSYLLRS